MLDQPERFLKLIIAARRFRSCFVNLRSGFGEFDLVCFPVPGLAGFVVGFLFFFAEDGLFAGDFFFGDLLDDDDGDALAVPFRPCGFRVDVVVPELVVAGFVVALS